MISINTNLSSLIAQNSMKKATFGLNQAIERMTTGFKINHAKDNAANYSIATNMTTKINAYMVAEDNVAMGLDMLTTANENLNLISDKLTRLRDLATQASNGTYGESSLKAINAEANALVDEIERLYNTTEYNGKKLLAPELPIPADVGVQRTGDYGDFIADPKTYTDAEVAAMTPLTDDVITLAVGEKYSISSASQLENLAELVNSGVDTRGVEFVLANDIDLSSISNWTPIGNYTNEFKGTFDGNGHKIKNLTINNPTEDNQGLFGYACFGQGPCKIKNFGLENVNIVGRNNVGAIIGCCLDSYVSNVYITGVVKGMYYVGGINGCRLPNLTTSGYNNIIVKADIYGDNFVGGLSGIGAVCNYNNCEIEAEVVGNNYVGGLIGSSGSVCTMSQITLIADIKGNDYVGGLTGLVQAGSMSNLSLKARVNGNNNIGSITGCFNNYDTSLTSNNVYIINNDIQAVGSYQYYDTHQTVDLSVFEDRFTRVDTNDYKTNLQIGTNGDRNSQISAKTDFDLEKLYSLRRIGLDKSTDFLARLDNLLSVINSKETEFGAVQNRLESALSEIETQYNNLVSSRSTLRDADIAEESSTYIRQQILQEASATLLATANQSPAIALQLI